jgi:hypothetical protein
MKPIKVRVTIETIDGITLQEFDIQGYPGHKTRSQLAADIKKDLSRGWNVKKMEKHPEEKLLDRAFGFTRGL